MDLREILNRRSDLSTFLVHLTRDYGERSAKENLQRIIEVGQIRARNVYGMCANRQNDLTEAGLASQRVVCFSETPLEYTYFMIQQIEARQFHFGPYGIAIPKVMGRKRGINPIWYLDMTPGHDWLTNNVNRLVDRFIDDDCDDDDLAAIFPFMEQMGTWPGNIPPRKEFWWEREWRHVGSFDISPIRFLCLCPEGEIGEFEGLLQGHDRDAACIDPRWSLEKIIAKLGGFHNVDIDVAE